MSIIQRSPDSQRKIRILSSPAPGALSPPPPRSPRVHPQARFAAPGKVRVFIGFHTQAFDNLLAHCAESNVHGREICGLLLGTKNERAEGYFPMVTDILPLEASDASGAHVSANEDVWLRAEAQIEEHFQGRERLGWYHTHPTQGIFFSGSDKDFHSLFTQPFQFALVVDPRVPKVGLFHWKDRLAGQIAGPIPLQLKEAPAHIVLPMASLASHRLMLLVLVLAGFVTLLATDQSGRLLPLAFLFTAALFLRLWNAGAGSDRAPANRELRVGPTGGTLLLGALLLPFFVAGLRLGTPLPAQWAALSQEPQASPSKPTPVSTPTREPTIRQAQVTPPPAVQEGTGASQPPRMEAAPPSIEISSASTPKRLLRDVTVWNRSNQVVLLFPNGKRADYVRDGQGSFTVAEDQERALLRYLLGVKAPDYLDIQHLQKAVGIDRPDGSWGSNSRSALVRTALEGSRSGREIQMTSRDRILSIAFRER